MYDESSVPYFPMACRHDGADWVVKNTLNESEHLINSSAYWLLQFCDGSHTWDEIVYELAKLYQIPESSVMERAHPVLSVFTDEGILWWRRQKIDWWHLPPPDFVLWNITNRCNLHCIHCAVEGGLPGKGELNLEQCKSLIDDLSSYGVKFLILSGGEPLIRRDFFSIADYMHNLGMKFQLATNGTLITKEKALHLASLDACAHVSLDSINPDTHDRFRQCQGGWKRTVRGIQHLVDAGVQVIIGAVVTKMNLHEIPDLYDFSAQFDNVAFRILPFIPFGRGRIRAELEVSPEEMRTLTAILLEKKKMGKNDIVPMEFECTFSKPSEGLMDPQAHIGCAGAISYCEITAGGQVFPCNFFEGVKTENIKEIPFPWIWENSRFLNYFRSLNIADIRGPCQQCSWLSECRGSCIASNFIHGDIFQSNCRCWLVSKCSRK